MLGKDTVKSSSKAHKKHISIHHDGEKKAYIYKDGKKYLRVFPRIRQETKSGNYSIQRFRLTEIYLERYKAYLDTDNVVFLRLSVLNDEYKKHNMSFSSLDTENYEPFNSGFMIYDPQTGNYFQRTSPPTDQEMIDFCNMCIISGMGVIESQRTTYIESIIHKAKKIIEIISKKKLREP